MFTPGSVSGALNPPPYLAALMFQHRGRYFSGLGAASPVKRKAAPRACSPTQRDSHDGKLGDGNKHHHPSVALGVKTPASAWKLELDGFFGSQVEMVGNSSRVDDGFTVGSQGNEFL